jgi:formylglycine-generating enzyme required for sulfatase activity
MIKLLILSLLALCYQTASAQLVTESFGSGDNAFTMEFVTIGNPGNVADTTGSPNPAGSVAYTYNIGKYEVSRDMIDKANAAGSLGITLRDMTNFGGNGASKPATGISWYEAATYVNWLNTSTGGTAAYKFVGGTFKLWSAGDAGYNANNIFRNSLAKYVIASSDEWYKGAYGKSDGSWSDFPNGSDSAPTAVAGGTSANTAVYAQSYGAGPADITNAGGLSAYGTMAQGGNVWEWNETAYDGTNDTEGEKEISRGGSWISEQRIEYTDWLDARFLQEHFPASEYTDVGFRVVSVPEPSAISLLAVALGGWAMMRRRRS